MGYARTAILIAAMTALFMGIGALLGGQGGMMIALVVALGMNFFAYWNSDKVVLRMYNARQVDRNSAPEFYTLVERLAQNAGLPMPKVYIIDSPQPNAFATGRNPENAAVAATSGLLNMMNRDEIEGVMAHELAHVKNRDTLTMTITATLAGAISMLANFAMFFGGRDENGNRTNPILGIAIMILAPIAAAVVQFAISRSREYQADKAGAEISGKPLALASALAKLERGARQLPMPAAEHNPATAHMFIMNPLSGAGRDNLFSTHPATGNRIAALEVIAGQTLTDAQSRPRMVSAEPVRATTASSGPWGGAPARDDRPRGPWG